MRKVERWTSTGGKLWPTGSKVRITLGSKIKSQHASAWRKPALRTQGRILDEPGFSLQHWSLIWLTSSSSSSSSVPDIGLKKRTELSFYWISHAMSPTWLHMKKILLNFVILTQCCVFSNGQLHLSLNKGEYLPEFVVFSR